MDGLSLLARHVAALEDPPKPARSAQALPNSWLPWTPVQPFIIFKVTPICATLRRREWVVCRLEI